MFIDIHVHASQTPNPPHYNDVPGYSTPEQLIERYDKLGIEKAVLLPIVSPECALPPRTSEDALEIWKKYPDRFIPFCSVDPRSITNSVDAPLDRWLRFYKDQGCRGIGEVIANLPFNHPMMENLFKHVQDVGLPLIFHVAPTIGGCYGIYDDPGLPLFERALQCFPKLNFLGHSPSFWAEIAALRTPGDRAGYPNYPVTEEGVLPKMFRRYPNLHGDLSAGSGFNALNRDRKYAIEFLNEFQDRLFFGTDICAPGTPTPLVDFLLGLRKEGLISEDVFQKVARENAVGLLGLG